MTPAEWTYLRGRLWEHLALAPLLFWTLPRGISVLVIDDASLSWSTFVDRLWRFRGFPEICPSMSMELPWRDARVQWLATSVC